MIGHLVVDEGEGVVTGATGIGSHKETPVRLAHLLQQLDSFLREEREGGEGVRLSRAHNNTFISLYKSIHPHFETSTPKVCAVLL